MKQPAMLKHLAISALVLALCGCQTAGMRDGGPISPPLSSIDDSFKDAQASQPAATSTPPPEVAAALLPPVYLNMVV